MEEQKLLGTEEVRAAVTAKSFNYLRRMFKQLEAADIAEALSELTGDETYAVFRLIEKARRAEIFSYLSFDKQEELLSIVPEEFASFILNDMEPVDRTQLLEELSPEISGKLIQRLDPEERRIARRLLSFPEDSVGRLMSPEFFAVPAGMSVAESIDYIRWNAARYPEEALAQIFVVNEEQRYLGDVSLGALFVADDTSAKVEAIIGSSYVTLSAYAEESVAVDMFRKYDRASIPVIDRDGKLVGLVTADDVFDVAEEEATEDIQQFGGTGVLEDSYFETPLLVLLRKRAGWLMILFIGGMGSGRALSYFQDTLTAFTFLIIFMPLVVSSGGNSGSQAASLVIRGLAIKELALKDWYKVLFREALSGMGLGLILALIGFSFGMLWNLDLKSCLVISFSLVGVVTFGSVVGAMLPFVLKRCGVDPAVSSSPLIASLADIFGIIIFLNIALFLLSGS